MGTDLPTLPLQETENAVLVQGGVDYDDLKQNSIKFDQHKYVTPHERIDAIVDDLIEEILIAQQCSTRKQEQWRRTLRCLLANLFVAHDKGGMWVAVDRSPGAYNAKSRYNRIGVSYKILIPIIDTMQEMGLLVVIPGSHYCHAVSRIKATPRLISKLLIDEPSELVRVDVEPIVLRNELRRYRDKKGNKVVVFNETEYEDTRQTIGMRRKMERINDALQQASIVLPLTASEDEALQNRMGHVVDKTRQTVQRLFRDDFKHGGRMFRLWVQQIPREYRPRILLDGEPCCELDYSSMHPRLLYAQIGVPAPDGDLYDVGDIEPERRVVKVMMQAIINAESYDAAVSGCQRSLSQDHGIKREQARLKPVADALMELHAPIREYFNSGLGLALQFEESELAVDIMCRLLNQGITSIPVHDSFMVARRHEDELRVAMEEAYKNRMGVDPVIDRKYP